MRKVILLMLVLLVAVDSWAQCSFVCPTSDEVAIQQAIDVVHSTGGGVVLLDARTYELCGAIELKSGVHLRGASMGTTIIRGSASQAPTVASDGTALLGTIAAAGAKDVQLSDLTIDHVTCARHSNGFAMHPSDDGTLTTRASVYRTSVLGAAQFHEYMIWNLKGRHIRIYDNFIDGGYAGTGSTFEEGIESFGGHDVVIERNTIRNIGGACINMGSAGLSGTETVGLVVSHNYVENCGVGVHHGTSMDGSEPRSNYHTKIEGNVILDSRLFGIDIAVTPGTEEDDLLIAENTVRSISANGAIGIYLRANGGPIQNAVTATTVRGNHIEDIRGSNAHGIRVLSYPNARIIDNTVTGTDSVGVWSLDADDIEVVGNRIELTSTPINLNASVPATGFARFVVERNLLRNWTSASGGVVILGGKMGTVKDNVLTRTDTLQPSPVVLASQTCGVTVSGNVAWYYPSWPGLSSPPC